MSLGGALIALALLGDPGPTEVDGPTGVDVVAVLDASAGRRAGLRAGDRIVGGAPVGGMDTPIRSPFDVREIEMDAGAVQAIRLRVERGADELTLMVEPGEWGLVLRPHMTDAVRERYETGLAAARRDDRAQHWRASAVLARARGQLETARWLFAAAGRAWAEGGGAEPAEAAFQDAAALAGDDVARAQIASARGDAFLRSAATYDRAEEALREAVRLRESVAAKSLAAAAAWQEIGECLVGRSDPAAFERAFRVVLELRQTLAPNTLVHADALISIGLTDYVSSRVDSAEAVTRQALEIAESLEPHGAVAARALLGLGRIAWAKGRLPEAVEHYRRILGFREPIEPLSFEVAHAYFALGIMAVNRGDLAVAEELLDTVLDKYERAPPRVGVSVAVLGLRGDIAAARGEHAAALMIFRRVLEVQERISPGSLTVAITRVSIGNVAVQMGDLAAARVEYDRSLRFFETNVSDSQWHSWALYGAGEAARREGDLASASTSLEKALTLEQARAPGGLSQAAVLHALGAVAEGQNDLDRAAGLYARALRVRQDLAPGTQVEAESLLSLGLLAHRRGRDDDAREDMKRAVRALESHSRRIGGTQEARSVFQAQYGDVHRALLSLLVELGSAGEALHVLERSRARVLLQQMAERDVALPGEVDPGLENERRQLRAEYADAERKLADLSPVRSGAEVDAELERLRTLQGRRERLAQKVLAVSPRAASLRYPEPLHADGVAAALDPGTVLLSYSVGPEKTHLFVVAAGAPLEVHTLAVGDARLRERVGAFRARIVTSYDTTKALRAEARALFHTLLGPAVPRIAAARRLVLCPDGPLHLLPFAALVHGQRYLVEWKPLHVVASATLYAEIRRERDENRDRPSDALIAFGDPYPDAKWSRGLPPLPASRREVRDLGALFGARAQIHLGRDASETRVRSVTRGARYVHFACHAIVDDRRPLDSALLLSPDDAEDGRLQVWEMFESGRLDADLVTLSACQTGLGREAGGEGLLSLTRAFLFAGARSTLASLWSVPDTTTAAFMKDVYRRLLRGETKDRALRGAQLRMIRSADGAPFYWAAFQLFGDWR